MGQCPGGREDGPGSCSGCCSTGVCGPSADPLLAAFAADVEWLTARGVTIVRHNLSQDPQPFVSNTMAAIAWLFFRYVFSPWILRADAGLPA